MNQILIEGGRPLEGDIYVSGMKNAALPILFASILVRGKSILDNIPKITDITGTLDILSAMGAEVSWISPTTVEICTDRMTGGNSPDRIVKTMRGTSYLLGAELGRFGKSRIGMPGGCSFDRRPLDQHFKAFERMGARVECGSGGISATAENGLHGAQIFFNVTTVGGTINCILAAVLTPGETVIARAAKEPHIVDLVNYLNCCGADISGAGTDVIRVRGVSELHGCSYRILPDMIEAGTFMTAVAAAGGKLIVRDLVPKHMEPISVALAEMGVSLRIGGDWIEVESDGKLLPTSVYTQPYPGFPTDMQPQFAVLCCLAENAGISTITEGVFGARFQYIEELNRMGADIFLNGNVATIIGKGYLSGSKVRTNDLRAGAAMVVAGLAARGRTEVVDAKQYISRGYFNIAGKLRGVGAQITVRELEES